MELKEFIGKVVICRKTNRKYTIREITAPEFVVQDINKNAYGTYSTYCYENQNGDYGQWTFYQTAGGRYAATLLAYC